MATLARPVAPCAAAAAAPRPPRYAAPPPPPPAAVADELDEMLNDLGGYVRYVADGFRLKDWDFVVEFDAGLTDSLATITFAPRRRLGLVRVGPLFVDAADPDQRHGICHELAHSHFESLRDTVNTVRGSLGLGAWEVLKANLDDQIETATDEWAAIGAKQMVTFADFRAHQAAAAARDATLAPAPRPTSSRRGRKEA